MNTKISIKNKASTDGNASAEVFRNPGIRQASILFSVNIILLVFIASRVQKKEFYSGTLITEYMLMLFPALVLLYLGRYNPSKILRLNRIGMLNAVLIVFIIILAIPVVSALNLAYLMILKHFVGKIILYQPPVESSIPGFLLGIFVIAVTPGICEEIIYRGVIQRGFENMGAARSITLAALLFGLMHMDFQKLLGTFLLGLLIGFIVYRTNSIFGGMLAHFTNNAFSLTMAFISAKLGELTNIVNSRETVEEIPNLDITNIFNLSGPQLISAIFSIAMLLLFFITSLAGLLTALVTNTSGCTRPSAKKTHEKYTNFLWLIPGILIVFIVYFLEYARLTGLNTGWLGDLLKFIFVD